MTIQPFYHREQQLADLDQLPHLVLQAILPTAPSLSRQIDKPFVAIT